MLDSIRIKGAREHNLKNIDIVLPRDQFIVITGLSGSGKSTLAFDTIYAEGQRRYVESLSAYARQFLGIMNKPDVDSIEGLSPAISIEQKTTSKNPRSTVGTVTEIYDYLRLLYARVGTLHCPHCDETIKPQSPEAITNLILKSNNPELIILAPIIRGKKGTHEKVFEDVKKMGYSRIRVDGTIYHVDSVSSETNLKRYEKHWIEAVVDRVRIEDASRSRIAEAIEGALKTGEGRLITLRPDAKASEKELQRGKGETLYSTYGACPNHPDVIFEQMESRMFSFNSPFGACPTCHGIGEIMELSSELIIPDESKSILDGAIAFYGRGELSWRAREIRIAAHQTGFKMSQPIRTFTKEQRDALFYGTTEHDPDGYEGLIPQTMRLYRQTESSGRKENWERYMVSQPCTTCNGKRLKDTVLAVKIAGKSIIDVTDMSIETCLTFFSDIDASLSEKERTIAVQVLKEIRERLGFLNNVGLGYLTLSRSAKTLSGGEAQRIRLATQIGSNLMGVLYILDEPSIGLHQRDNAKLIATLHRLRDLGNTLIVVEHDEDTIRAADHIVDMGPGAGINGGHIIAQGTPAQITKSRASLTGKYLAGIERIETPKNRREPLGEIALSGAKENNLKNISVTFPTGVLCAITGVSGSGKSTLMNQTFMPALKKQLGMSTDRVGTHASLTLDGITDVIIIDQDPIGRTPRSNPATYTKLFDDIRTLFSSTKLSRQRGYKPGRFSFNLPGGRCEECAGDGLIKIEMNFLPDVYVTCEQCKGKRYNTETLDVAYSGKTIADVLDMDVDSAYAFFTNHPSIMRKLKTLQDVGLGYIKLGQSSTTLSGGESQRIKLTRELSKYKKGNTLYLLDEPTTGLHFEDVRKLIAVLNRLVDKGNSVYVIEHNLDVIKSCDHIIDMGPEGGDRGGRIIAQGTPEQVAKSAKSHTGAFLKSMLAR